MFVQLGDAIIGKPEGTMTILDDDFNGKLAISDVAVSEDSGSATLGVTRTEGTSGYVHVVWVTKDGSATYFDYEDQNGGVEWEDGDDTTQYIEIILKDDLEPEQTEIFMVILLENSVDGGATVEKAEGIVTILDDDQVSVSLVASSQTVSQGSKVTLTWNSTNADSCTGSWSGSPLGTSGNTDVTVNSTTIYTVSCTNEVSQDDDSVTVQVNVSEVIFADGLESF